MSVTLSQPAELTWQDHRRCIFAIIGGSIGNLIEWYDFYIYSFGALYFAPVFFPAHDRTSQLLLAAGVFAAGFLMRPLGGWVEEESVPHYNCSTVFPSTSQIDHRIDC
jgi:hypothetical protein